MIVFISRRPSPLLVMGLVAATAFSQSKTATWLQANFQARSHTSAEVTMVYRLHKPANYDSTQKYPIVVALHGIGERGNNNVNQLTLEELAQPWVRDSVQAKHPHFVMVPQCPTNLFWWGSNTWDGTRSNPNVGIVQILDSLKREFSLDTTRFYAVGLSMGGFGVFELMRWNPEMFAAAVPTAGGGDTTGPTIAKHIQTPFWAFHGATDPTVNVDRGSRSVILRVELAGKPVVRFVSDTGMKNPTAISVDSLRKAVYTDKADFLYSEVRNVPGSGNPLHQAGWFAAWRHPMLTDWVFSKQKVNGVTVSVNPRLAAVRPGAQTNSRLVLQGNRLLLERVDAKGISKRHTLEGRFIPE